MKTSVFFFGFLLIILNLLVQLDPQKIKDAFTQKDSNLGLNANIMWILAGEGLFVLILAMMADSGGIGSIFAIGTLVLIWMIWFLSHSDLFLGNTTTGNALGWLGHNLFGSASKQ